MRILIIEDEQILSHSLTKSLTASGYATDAAFDGEQADQMLMAATYDLVILDLGLPKMSGMEVLSRARTRGMVTPVLILTARDSIDGRVQGLDAGADDYMTKPFDLSEFEARVRALVRRGALGANAPLICGTLRLSRKSNLAYCNGINLNLSAKEFSLLEILLTRQKTVVSKEVLMESLYNWDENTGENAIEVYIHRLRKKLEVGTAVIRTIRGLGYLLEDAPKP